MMIFLIILFFLLLVAFVFFCGLFVYGAIKNKISKNWLGISKPVWIGLIGLTSCNVGIQIINLIIKTMN